MTTTTTRTRNSTSNSNDLRLAKPGASSQPVFWHFDAEEQDLFMNASDEDEEVAVSVVQKRQPVRVNNKEKPNKPKSTKQQHSSRKRQNEVSSVPRNSDNSKGYLSAPSSPHRPLRRYPRASSLLQGVQQKLQLSSLDGGSDFRSNNNNNREEFLTDTHSPSSRSPSISTAATAATTSTTSSSSCCHRDHSDSPRRSPSNHPDSPRRSPSNPLAIRKSIQLTDQSVPATTTTGNTNTLTSPTMERTPLVHQHHDFMVEAPPLSPLACPHPSETPRHHCDRIDHNIQQHLQELEQLMQTQHRQRQRKQEALDAIVAYSLEREEQAQRYRRQPRNHHRVDSPLASPDVVQQQQQQSPPQLSHATNTQATHEQEAESTRPCSPHPPSSPPVQLPAGSQVVTTTKKTLHQDPITGATVTTTTITTTTTTTPDDSMRTRSRVASANDVLQQQQLANPPVPVEPCPSLTASPPSPAPAATRTTTPKQIEICPGFSMPLRGAEETLDYLGQGDPSLIASTFCFACNHNVHVLADAALGLCPTCRSVIPLEDNDNGHGVSLGFLAHERDELQAVANSLKIQ